MAQRKKGNGQVKIIYLPVGELVEYENNPRKNDGAVDAVAASIEAFGFKIPIVVDKARVIVAGHTRLKAAVKLGLETVPVIVADDLTPEQVRAFRLADNKTAELAKWDMDALDIEMSEITIDMEPFGFAADVPSFDVKEDASSSTSKGQQIVCPHCGFEWIK